MNTTRSPTSRAKLHLVRDDEHRTAVAPREIAHDDEHFADQFRVEGKR